MPTASTDAEVGGGTTAAGKGAGTTAGGGGTATRCTAQFGDRLQQLLAMAERHDGDVLEVVVCQPAQQLAVDVVGAEHLGILGEADPAEPTVDIQVQSPGLLSVAVFEKG